MNVQEAVAKAVLVDQDAFKKAQLAGDVLAGHEVLMDAYNTDVRGLLREWRSDKGIDPEPMKAYAASGYAAKIAADRVGGNQAGWGA
jgi:L-rhamnose isomerase/sugar isomerase